MPECKFIYPSSVSVQGNQPDKPIREDCVSSPISPYGFHKKIAEELCKSYHSNFNITIGIIRFFSIYGPGLQKQLLYDACKKMATSKSSEVTFWGTGDETRDWIYIEDAASLIYLFALEVNGMDIINGGSGARVEISEFLDLVRNKMNMIIDIKFNGEIREGDPRYFWSDTSKAKKYNWEPKVALEKGIESYVEYYKGLKL
jgi:UDP-glucose 4-epimerase